MEIFVDETPCEDEENSLGAELLLGPNSAAGRRDFEAGGFEVDAYLEVNGHASFAVFQLFDTEDLADVFAVHGVVRRGIGKRDEYAHAGIVGVEARHEIEAVARGVNANGDIFEMIVARLGRADTHGPSDFGATAAAVVGERSLEFVGHGSAGGRMKFLT